MFHTGESPFFKVNNVDHNVICKISSVKYPGASQEEDEMFVSSIYSCYLYYIISSVCSSTSKQTLSL